MRRSKGEKIVFGIVFVLFAIYALSLLLPFVFLTFNSLKDGEEYVNGVAQGQSFFPPEHAIWSNYFNAFRALKITDFNGKQIGFLQMLFNSIWYTVLYVGAGVVASSITAYIVAKYRFRGRRFVDGIAIFSMTIPIIGTTASALRMYNLLGIYNTPLLPLLIGFGGFGFNFLVLRGFFTNLPWSYAESVFVEGGGYVTAFLKIMMPQAVPCLVTLFIMAFIGTWNDYQTLLLYMPSFPTLSSGLYLVERSLTRHVYDYPIYFAALDTAVGICSPAIMRSVAAPSPEFRCATSFYQRQICEKYLTVPNHKYII